MLDQSKNERNYWNTPIGITKEQWMVLLEDRDMIKEQDLQLLKLIYNRSGYKATAGQLAHLLNMPHHAPLNRQIGQLGKRIVKKLNIQAIRQRDGEGYNWWEVPFTGYGSKEGYYWVLRPELQEAMCELNARGEILLMQKVNFPEEIDMNSYHDLYEGAKKQVYVNSYERNSFARERCVKHYGARCVICGFEFKEVYGEVGRDVIHVHHLKPLHEIGETYRVDPINDLRPVCPNCHLIIHRKNPPYSIDEVIAMLKEAAIEGLYRV